MRSMKIVGTSSLKGSHGGKWTVLAVLVCLTVSMVASSVFVGPVHAQGYYFVLKWGSRGSGNGNFSYPRGVAVDSSGNVYVADTSNNRIEKFSSNGTFLTRWGYYGYVGNHGPLYEAGNFDYPYGVAVDTSGNVYVADTSNCRIQKFSSSGNFLGAWGSYGSQNGNFSYPYGVAVDSSGNVYVADTDNCRIEKFDRYGTFSGKWGSYGSQNGNFSYPLGVAVDSSGNVYVADSSNNRIEKFSNLGAFLAKWGSYGSQNGNFSYPLGVAVDSSGNVYVVDQSNHRIEKFNSSGTFLTKWGIFGSGDGEFYYPVGVAVDSSGNVYVADMDNHRIEKFSLDATPPTTVIYEYGTAGSNNWFTSNVAIVLTASDTQTGVVETMYSLNGGATWLNYTTPITITSEGTTTIQYYSVDRMGNREATKSKNITVDTLPPSIALAASLTNGTKIKSSKYTLNWTATDAVSGIDHYLVRLDMGTWLNVGNKTTHTFTSLANGNHTFTIEAVDKAGNSKTCALNLKVSTGGGLGLIGMALIGVVVAAVACVGAVGYKMRKRPKKPLATPPPPRPTKLVIQAEPTEILADGKSTSMITVRLQDDSNKLIAALADTEVKVATTGGTLETPVVKILKGKDTETTVITSSTEVGLVTVSASASGFKTMRTTLNFTEKKRFCMHCGVLMPLKATRCPRCGKAPPAGLDTKACKNCKSVIPVVAKFCSECGAGQAD
jgi:DNA-binding beta-propeller fold protein YncE/RNA polymerase subunit RPABC4/transcription elongation factor Spt4